MSTPDLSRATWRKSTWSGGNGGQCVEVAVLGTAVGLRDSKDSGAGSTRGRSGGLPGIEAVALP